MPKRKQWRLTIFPKLVLAFLLVIAPIYSIGLEMNRLGESTVREEISKSLKSRVDFYLNSLEVENERMMRLLQEYVVDKDLQQLAFLNATMNLYQKSQTIQRIYSKLTLMKSSSVYIKTVSAHILTLSRTLSSEMMISDELDEAYEAVASVSGTGGSSLYYWKDRLFLAIAYPGSDLPGMQETFVLSVELDLAAMQRALQSFSDYGQSGAVLAHAELDWMLGEYGLHSVAPDTAQPTEAPVALPAESSVEPSTDADVAPLAEPTINSPGADPVENELIAFLEERSSSGEREGLDEIEAGGSGYLAAYKFSPTFGYYLIAYAPQKEFLNPIYKYRNLLWMLSFISLVIVIVYSYWLYRLIRKPLHRMITGFRKVEAGLMEAMPLPRTNDEFLFLFQRFNMMVEKLNVLIHEVYEQKIRARTSELKQLQSQINPHFLYNTYFILYRLAKMNDNDSVVRFSQHLGEYFQYITRNAEDDVPLEAEIRHARTYVEIQNIRFARSRITVAFGELPESTGEMHVPRLIVQPFIENAYKYGLESKRKNGRIVIEMKRERDSLLVSVEDNGEKLTEAALKELETSLSRSGGDMEYTGILNVHRRLQIRYGSEFGVFVERGEMKGLKATIKLPPPSAKAIGEAAEGGD